MTIETKIKYRRFKMDWFDKDQLNSRDVWNEHTDVRVGGTKGYEYLEVTNQRIKIRLSGKHFREIKAAMKGE